MGPRTFRGLRASADRVNVRSLSVACRGLVMPGATSWLYAP